MNGRPVDLTDREREVFQLIAEGCTPAQIAAQLYLTPATVNTTMKRVREKLGAMSTAHAVLIAERFHRHLLKGVVAKHGTQGAIRSHRRNGTPVCDECLDSDAWTGSVETMVPYLRAEPKTPRLRPHEPVDCGTMAAVRRHVRRKERISELTCGCRESYAAWHRDYRSRSARKAA